MTPIEILLAIFLLTSMTANLIQLKRQETLESWFEEMSTDLDISQFISVDQIVAGEIAELDTVDFDKVTLMDIYNGLE